MFNSNASLTYTASDIEIFVITYNRLAFLPVALRSVIEQTESGASVCILDNGSSVDVANTVAPFIRPGVRYIRNEINNPRVFDQVKGMASRSWTIIFHDDDILHCQYLWAVLHTINTYPGLSLVVSGMKTFRGTYEKNNWHISKALQCIYCSTYSDLAYLLFNDGFSIPFCSAVYKTDILQKQVADTDSYGKTFDRPYMMDMVKEGKAVVLKGKYVRYRLHDQQDTKAKTSGPFAHQLIALDKYYSIALGNDLFTRTGRLFFFTNYFRLSRWYDWIKDNGEGITKKRFIQMAVDAKAATGASIMLGSIYEAVAGLPYRVKKAIRHLLG